MTEKITDKLVKKLTPPDSGNKIFYDTDVKGFGVRATSKGTKSFVLNYRIAGRERRYTIGAYPDWTVAAAREEAKALKRMIDGGLDPLSKRISQREAPTMKDLWNKYESDHLPTKSERAQADDRAMFNKVILPELGGPTKVADVSFDAIARLHLKISERTPTRANRIIEVLRKAMNLAIRWGWRSNNPATGIRKNTENKRERYLSAAEIGRLTEALDAHSEQISADAIRLLILTGARKSEVLNATWDQFDFGEGSWTKPSSHTKQRKAHHVPLSAPTLQLLQKIAKNKSGPHVFPGKVDGKPLQDLRRTWRAVTQRATLDIWLESQVGLDLYNLLRERLGRNPRHAELQSLSVKRGIELPVGLMDVNLHDLRHSFASILVNAGASLPLIGSLLGHTQPATTARYAHLYQDALRDAAEKVGSVVSSARPGSSNVIKFSNK